jgi:hypothetical protein
MTTPVSVENFILSGLTNCPSLEHVAGLVPNVRDPPMFSVTHRNYPSLNR